MIFRNGWVKIALAFMIMALSFTLPSHWLCALQFVLGVAYFMIGLRLVLRNGSEVQSGSAQRSPKPPPVGSNPTTPARG
jgi:hypothetical protein